MRGLPAPCPARRAALRQAAHHADPARLVGSNLQVARLLQPAHVLVRRAGLAEAEGVGDLLQRGRRALGPGMGLDEAEHVALSGSEVVGHG